MSTGSHFEGISIIDADAHVIEPNGMWADFVSSPFRDLAPRSAPYPVGNWASDAPWLVQLEVALSKSGVSRTAWEECCKEGPRNLAFAGEPVWDGIASSVWLQGTLHTLRFHLPEAAAGFSAAATAHALRSLGVSCAYLYPTTGLWVLGIDGMDAALAAALTSAYNDWLAHFTSEDPELLRPVAAVTLHEPLAAAREVERIAARGWTAVTVRPNPIQGRAIGHPSHEPFFAACERLGVSIAFHEGTHARMEAAGATRFSSRFGRHACSHPMEQMMAFLALVEGGVLERHPQLQCAFMEAGCSWLPYWLWRLDSIEHENLAWEIAPNARMKPSEYFRRQCYVACEPTEPLLPEVIDLVGADRVLYGSDYPHMDHEGDVRRDAELLIERVGAPTARRILNGNPARFYRNHE